MRLAETDMSNMVGLMCYAFRMFAGRGSAESLRFA